MPFIQGTAAGKVALSPFLNFRAEHYWGKDVLGDFIVLTECGANQKFFSVGGPNFLHLAVL
jgi:hypothetical protein